MKVNARNPTVDTQIAANPTRDNYLSTRVNSTLDRPIVIFRRIKRHLESPACELFSRPGFPHGHPSAERSATCPTLLPASSPRRSGMVGFADLIAINDWLIYRSHPLTSSLRSGSTARMAYLFGAGRLSLEMAARQRLRSVLHAVLIRDTDNAFMKIRLNRD
jgi:hypothetical protein